MDNIDEVYYRIYYYEPDNNVTVICMQKDDERDYIQECFFVDEEGYGLKFNNESQAADWLNNNVISSMIDPKYRKFEQSKFMIQR